MTNVAVAGHAKFEFADHGKVVFLKFNYYSVLQLPEEKTRVKLKFEKLVLLGFAPMRSLF